MNNQERSEWYGDMIFHVCPMAAAIGRMEPYHLTYLKKYRGTIPQPVKTECGGFFANRKKTEQRQKINGTKRPEKLSVLGAEVYDCQKKDSTGYS